MSTYLFTEWKDPEPVGVEPIPGEFLLTFWTPILGPTGVLILRAVASCVRRRPEWRVGAEDLGAMVGVRGAGKSSPLVRTVARLEQFGFVRWRAQLGPDSAYEVRLSAPELHRRQVQHLPGALKLAYNLRREQKEAAS